MVPKTQSVRESTATKSERICLMSWKAPWLAIRNNQIRRLLRRTRMTSWPRSLRSPQCKLLPGVSRLPHLLLRQWTNSKATIRCFPRESTLNRCTFTPLNSLPSTTIITTSTRISSKCVTKIPTTISISLASIWAKPTKCVILQSHRRLLSSLSLSTQQQRIEWRPIKRHQTRWLTIRRTNSWTL